MQFFWDRPNWREEIRQKYGAQDLEVLSGSLLRRRIPEAEEELNFLDFDSSVFGRYVARSWDLLVYRGTVRYAAREQTDMAAAAIDAIVEMAEKYL